jgi:hypothetical protein
MFFQYEGFKFSSFKHIKSTELVIGKKYLIIFETQYMKGIFVSHSEFKYLMHFDVGVIKSFPVKGTWVFEFIEVKKKIIEAVELRALNIILKNLIDEQFILN